MIQNKQASPWPKIALTFLLLSLTRAQTTLAGPNSPRRGCFHYKIDRLYPCQISIIRDTEKNLSSSNLACGQKTDLKPLPQYVCDYIGVNLSSPKDYSPTPDGSWWATLQVSNFNDEDYSRQKRDIKSADRDYQVYLGTLSGYLTFTAKMINDIRQNRWLSPPGWGKADGDILLITLRPFLGKQINAFYVSDPRKGPWQNTWNWKSYLAVYEKRNAELRATEDGNTAAMLRETRKKISKNLGEKYGNLFQADFNKDENALNARELGYNHAVRAQKPHLSSPKRTKAQASKGAPNQNTPTERFREKAPPPKSAETRPPEPFVFLPNNLHEIHQRNYFAQDSFSISQGARRISEEAQVAIWHALGMTQTIGNPERRVPLAFTQKDGTCALAALTQYLQAYGKKVTVEDVSKLARDQGLADFPEKFSDSVNATSWNMRGGPTPFWSVGETAKYYGYRVSRSWGLGRWGESAKKTQQENQMKLDKAIRRDKGALMGVSSAVLWHRKDLPIQPDHVVYVTGEEINTTTHKILGYYINDSGTGEGGRFVEAQTFLRAWKSALDFMVVIKPVSSK